MSDKSKSPKVEHSEKRNVIISTVNTTNQGKPADKAKPSTVDVDKDKQSAVDVDKNVQSIVHTLTGKQSKTNVGEGCSIVQVDEGKKTLGSATKGIASATGAQGKEQIQNVSKGFKKTKDVETITLTHKPREIAKVTKKVSELQGTAQWQALMRKFSQSHKETCKTVPHEIPKMPRSKKQFPTGSTYTGSWNALGMSGHGTYEFPHEEVIYEGEFDDGMFHGEGQLRYSCGAIIKGKWNKGKVYERQLIFADGLEYDENEWNYLRYPDRRFTIEYDHGLEPAGKTYKTAEQPSPYIPPGYYDVGDGFYLPETKTVYTYEDISAIVRSPEAREQQWILSNCRTNPDTPQGPCDYLYERWMPPALLAEVPPAAAARTKTFEGDEPDEDLLPTSDRPRAKSNKIRAFDSRKALTSTTDFYRPDMLSNITTSSSSTAFKRMSKRSSNKSISDLKRTTSEKAVNTTENAQPSVTDYVAPGSKFDPYASSCGLIEPKSIINW